MSVRVRIFLSLLFAFIAGTSYLIYWIVSDLEPRYRASVEESLVDMSHILSGIIGTNLKDGNIDVSSFENAFHQIYQRHLQAKIYEVIKDHVDMRIYVTDLAGKVIFDSTSRLTGQDMSEWHDVMYSLQGNYGARTTRDDKDDPTSSVLYIAAPIYNDSDIVGVVSVGEPTKGLNQYIHLAKKKILSGALIATVAVLIGGLLLAFLLTRPIGLLVDYIKLLKDSRNVTLPRLGRSAVGIISRTFEDMSDALRGKGYVEKYVQTLTHEIKSPLSAIKGAAELMQEDMPQEQRNRFLNNILLETDRIKLFVDKLLELSALEKRAGLEDIKEINLTNLIREVIDALSPIAKTRSISLEIHSNASVSTKGDSFLVRQAITNLVQNSIDFAPQGSTVMISLSKLSDMIAIEVIDSGPGIPDYAQSKIFERFYSLSRPGTGRKSTGLGLSFVKEIADLHRGSIEVRNIESGGTKATLKLPAN